MKERGFGILEIVVGSAILLAVAMGAAAVFGNLARASEANLRAVKAAFLLEEGAEAVRQLRDVGWISFSSLPSDRDHFFSWSGSGWGVTENNVLIDGVFERKFRLAEVYRSANYDIAASGAVDPNTRLATVALSWKSGSATTSRELIFYLANLFE